jgi:OHCU decarboxylase
MNSISQSVQWLNELNPSDAKSEFLKCCGSTRWASAMTEARPFDAIDNVFVRADESWTSLALEDWLEAFRGHPRIGEKKAAAQQSKRAENWSAKEQSGVVNSAPDTKAALAQANLRYEQQFGFIFIICATGKSAEEMLAILHSRLQNDPELEIKVAAEEQRKITRLRLEKLLTQ